MILKAETVIGNILQDILEIEVDIHQMPPKALALHEGSLSLIKKVQQAYHSYQKDSALPYTLEALDKEWNAAEMFEPAMQAEPTRSALFRNSALIAWHCENYDAAHRLAKEAMLGMPSSVLIEEIRQILIFASEIKVTSQEKKISETKNKYHSASIITNLPRQIRFLNKFMSFMPKAKFIDILVPDFEIASFLLLSGQWQFADRTRLVVGQKTQIPSQQLGHAPLQDSHNLSIEREKCKADDLSGLPPVKNALADNRMQICSHTKDEIHGAAYIIESRVGDKHGYLGSADFSEKGLMYPLQLMGRLSSEHATEMSNLFESLCKSSRDLNEQMINLIERHLREYTPYQVYLKVLYEYFRGRQISTGSWESNESRVYSILSEYQRDGYKQLLHIARKYGGALLCDGVGLGKTFVALMLIERLVYERKRLAVIVPKSTRDSVWEPLIKQFIPKAQGLFGNQVVVYNHTDLLRVASQDRGFPAEMEQIREQCDAIIVDEAHHLRNLSSKRYQTLGEHSI